MRLACVHGSIVLGSVRASFRAGLSTSLVLGLAALGVNIDTSGVLVVACLLAACWQGVSVVGWAVGRVSIVVNLELVTRFEVRVDIVTRQAWKIDVSSGAVTSVSLAWVVWLLA